MANFAPLWIKYVPARYHQFVGLNSITPRSDTQARILDAIRKNVKAKPEPDGLCIFGPPDEGKTVIETAYFSLALYKVCGQGTPPFMRGVPAARTSCKRWLDQMQQCAINPEAPRPVVTFQQIKQWRQYGRRFYLSMEEPGKMPNDTQSRIANLFELVQELEAEMGWFSTTTNLHPREFSERFGEDFAWRISKMCGGPEKNGGLVFNLFDNN